MPQLAARPRQWRRGRSAGHSIPSAALLAALTLFETAGLPIYLEPTAAWWAQHPLWLLVPGVLLTALVAVFARAEAHPR